MAQAADNVMLGPPAPTQTEGPKPIGVPEGFQVPVGGGGAGPQQPPRYFDGDEVLPASRSVEERAHIINQMVDAGLLPTSYRNSGVWDGTVTNAYQQVLAFANASGRDAGAALTEMKSSAPPAGSEGKTQIIGGNVGGGQVFQLQMSDPASLRALADKAGRAVLGRKPKKSELDAIVASISGAEIKSQQDVDKVLSDTNREVFDVTNNTEVATAATQAKVASGQSPTGPVPGSPLTIISPVPGVKAPADTMGAARTGGRSHKGTDIFGAKGSPAVAPIGGTVRQVGNSGLGGLRVWIQGDDGRFHYLAHLDRIDVKAGQRVEQGVQIGTVGNTGNAKNTPAHIHYSINSKMGSEDAVGNPAKELAGQPASAAPGAAPDVVQVPNTYIPAKTVAVNEVDGQARAEEYLREKNPVEATSHDLAAGVYGNFLSIIGAN